MENDDSNTSTSRRTRRFESNWVFWSKFLCDAERSGIGDSGKDKGIRKPYLPHWLPRLEKVSFFERCFQEEGMSYVFEERAVYNVCVWRVCIGLNFAADNIMICTGQVLSYPCTATRHQTPKKSVSQAMASFSEERLNVQRNCSFNNSFYKIRLSRCSQTVPAIDAITSLALWGKRTRYLRGSVRTDRM